MVSAMAPFTLLSTLAIFVMFLTSEVSAVASSLTLDGKSAPCNYAVGEDIPVSYVNNQTNTNGILAIFAVTTPPAELSYNYIRTTAASGSVVFSSETETCSWPLTAGSYYIVLLDSGGIERTPHYPFTVGGDSTTPVADAPPAASPPKQQSVPEAADAPPMIQPPTAASELPSPTVSATTVDGTNASLTLEGKTAPCTYLVGESITVSYDCTQADTNGALAIFPVTTPPATVTNSFIRITETSATVVFSAQTETCSWPLKAGSYYIVLLDAAGYEQTPRCSFTVGPAAGGTSPAVSPESPRQLNSPMQSPTAASVLPAPTSPATVSGNGASLTLEGKSGPCNYAVGENITISFVNNKPGDNGIIAVFPVTTPQTSSSNTFVRTCGSVLCTNAVTVGVIVFSSGTEACSWPLMPGAYFVVFLSSTGYEQTPPCYFTVGNAPPANNASPMMQLPPTAASELASPPPTSGSSETAPPPTKEGDAAPPTAGMPLMSPPKTSPPATTNPGGSSLTLVSNPSVCVGETITITFVNGKPNDNGAIAVFADTNPPTTTSHTFARTCGTAFCTNAVASGTIVFSSDSQGCAWPLAPGKYYVVLLDSAGYEQAPRCSFTVEACSSPQAALPPANASPSNESPMLQSPTAASELVPPSPPPPANDAPEGTTSPPADSPANMSPDAVMPSNAPPATTSPSGRAPCPLPSTPGVVTLPSSTCASGTALVFSVTNPAPATGDWIGIWPAAAWASDSKGPTSTWVRLCGSCTCTDVVPSAQVTISGAVGGIIWPLPAGEYIAILLTGQGFAKSVTCPFTVTPAQQGGAQRRMVMRRLGAV